MKTILIRKAVKFVTPFKSIEKLHSHCSDLFQSMNKKFSTMLRSEKIINIGGNKKVLVEREAGEPNWLTEANFIKEFLSDEVAPYQGLKVAKHTRTVYQGVLRKYYGKKQRDENKGMPTFCAFRTRNLVFSDAFLWFPKGNTDILEYKNITGEKVQFKYQQTSKDGRIQKNALKYLPHMDPNKKFGATFVVNDDRTKCTVVATATIPLTFKYEPVDFIGIDMNVSEKFDNWLYFSEPIFRLKKISKSYYKDTIAKTEKRIAELNDLIRIPKKVQDRKINSKKRGILRKKLIKQHALHNEQIRDASFPFQSFSIIKGLCNRAEKEKKGLAIDSVKCGKTTGSFGQDKFPDVLRDECQRRGIPYIDTPTPFTSRRCPDCGFVEGEYVKGKTGWKLKPSEARDKKTNVFTCPKCESKHDGDFVGAKTLSVWASYLWSIDQIQGVPNKELWPFVKRSFLLKDVDFPPKEN